MPASANSGVACSAFCAPALGRSGQHSWAPAPSERGHLGLPQLLHPTSEQGKPVGAALTLAACAGLAIVVPGRRHRRQALACRRQLRAVRSATESTQPPASSEVPATGGAKVAPPEGWQEVAGSAVLFPSSDATALVHFLGGAFVGASPRLFYQTFLERLAEESGAIVIATPYKLAFDYDTTATGAAMAFESARKELADQGLIPDRLEHEPAFGIGHSCGALLHSLLAAERPYAGCILMSFNNRPVSEAIPVTLPPSPQDQRVRDVISNGLETVLADSRIEESLRVGGAFAELALGAVRGESDGTRSDAKNKEGTAREAAPIFSQLGPLLGSVVQGERDFTISQEEISSRLSGRYSAPRTLLVQFANDLTDETSRLASVLGKGQSKQPKGEQEAEEGEAAVEKAEEPLVVEWLRLPGGHTAPIDYPGLARGDVARISRLATAVGRFMRGEDPQGEGGRNPGELAELKAQLLRLTAGTNRGFSLARPERRAEIVRCVEEIEALSSPLDFSSMAEGGVPSDLFGKWRLVWATSPDVLLLAALPLVDCGEIRQDIPSQKVEEGKPLEVFNSVELSPRGFGLLGAVPQLARAASVKTVVRALAEPQQGGASLAIRFEGGRIEPALPGLPSLPLPEMPSVRATSSATGSSIKLLTTFLDSEFRFARSPLGDIFVLSRV